MLPTVKIKFAFDNSFNKWFSAYLHKLLADLVILEEVENPDYVFGSLNELELINYNCVRVGFTGENIRLDFNIVDYAIGFDFLTFGDRYVRFPLYLFYEEATALANRKHIGIDSSILDNKTGFCSFVVSNGHGAEQRVKVYEALSQYKKVDSGGRFLNNVGGPIANKRDFDQARKFSICFENSSTPGYLTEKLIEAISARTIPVYWGDSQAIYSLKDGTGSGLNEKAFIYVKDAGNVNEILERVKALDNNDEQYLSMLQEPIFLDYDHVSYFRTKLRNFLMHIFTQRKPNVFRRGFGQKILRIEERNKWIYKYNKLSGLQKKLVNSMLK